MGENKSHALLSPSSSSRWLACTPAPRLEEKLPDISGDAAKEGDTAHKVVELMTRKRFIDPMGAADYKKALKKLSKLPLYSEEMAAYGEAYMDFLDEVVMGFPTKPSIAAEQRVDLGDTVPECWGTCDFRAIGSGILHIVDYKYGRGVAVEAEHNPQMMLYAAGNLLQYAFIYGGTIKQVRMSIFQPRKGGSSTWETTTEDLMNWVALEAKPRAALALAGEGEFCPGEDTCRFCKAKGCCKARAAKAVAIAEAAKTAAGILTPREIAEYMKHCDWIKKWCDDLQVRATGELLAGVNIPGWKLVEGKSNRQFSDIDSAFKRILEAGTPEAMLYERKPLTLSATEKLLGASRFTELVGDLVSKPQGKPTLVPSTDTRTPYARPSAADDFEGVVLS